VRLGFKLETQTEEYIRAAIRSGVYIQTAQAHRRTPALQTRLRTELKYLFQVSYWQPALELLAELGALQCIHPTLKLDPVLLDQLRLLNRCLAKFDSSQSILHWQLKLELVITNLTPIDRHSVAQNLQLSADSINRLVELERVESEIRASLPSFDRISQMVRLLRRFDREILILIAVRCRDLPVRRRIWKYLTVWSDIQPILNGNDLRNLGYQPGPQYREILDNLLMATLDGMVIDRSSAQEFLCRL
jgi:tRNA nucleotidyltransferase (CCA-adding enzyme)